MFSLFVLFVVVIFAFLFCFLFLLRVLGFSMWFCRDGVMVTTEVGFTNWVFTVHFSANYCGSCSAKWTMNGADVTETCLRSSQSASSSGVTSELSVTEPKAKLPKPPSTGIAYFRYTDDCHQFLCRLWTDCITELPSVSVSFVDRLHHIITISFCVVCGQTALQNCHQFPFRLWTDCITELPSIFVSFVDRLHYRITINFCFVCGQLLRAQFKK